MVKPRQYLDHGFVARGVFVIALALVGCVEAQDRRAGREQSATTSRAEEVTAPAAVGQKGASYERSAVPDRAVVVEKRVTGHRALLIGVDNYAHLRPLRYCGPDVLALKEHLVAVGFPPENVVVLHNEGEPTHVPSKTNIERHLECLLGMPDAAEADAMPDAAGHRDTVILAFSGHGVQLGEQGYLCPMDAQWEQPATLISLDRVYRHLASGPGGTRLFVVDACRNDPLRAGARAAEDRSEIRALGSALTRVPRSIALLASCAPQQVSWEDESLGHGVFMHYLLEGLAGRAQEGDGRVRLLKLHAYASQETQRHVARTRSAQQTPVLTSDNLPDFVLGRVPIERKLLQLARELAATQSDPHLRASALQQVAVAQLKAGDHREARRTLEDAHRAARAIDDEVQGDASAARALAAIALAQHQAGAPQAARQAGAEAIRAARAIENDVYRALALSEAAAVQAQYGDINAARQTCAEAHFTARMIDEGYFRARAMESVARSYAAAGDIETALQTAGTIADTHHQSLAYIAIADALRRAHEDDREDGRGQLD